MVWPLDLHVWLATVYGLLHVVYETLAYTMQVKSVFAFIIALTVFLFWAS